MKAAICLSGAMSKLSDRFISPNSLYANIPYVDFYACHQSTVKHIIKANPECTFDFFIHSWNLDLESELLKIYSPKKFLVEDNSKYRSEILERTKELSDFPGISKALSMEKSLLLLEEFEKENSFEYDLIIIYRPDILLIKDMDLRCYDPNKIFVNKYSNGNGDFHFVMNSRNAKQFKNLYLSLAKGNDHKVHLWIKNYINNYMHQPLFEDDILAGYDQEVIRKISMGITTTINPSIISQYQLKDRKMDDNNTYTKMQRDFYNSTADIMAVENHRGHDPNPDYYGLLLKEVSTNPQAWKSKAALDFGCGIGRNVDNLLRLAEWDKADGCDISTENIVRAHKHLEDRGHKNFNLYVTTGTTLQPIADEQYDLVMSTIVFQHIAVHEIRSKLFQDIYRVMKPGALFSFQMAQYNMPNRTFANYYDNVWSAPGTNGAFDVNISNPQNLVDDLQKFGFKNVTYEIRPEWDANKKEYMDMSTSRWIFVKAYK